MYIRIHTAPRCIAGRQDPKSISIPRQGRQKPISLSPAIGVLGISPSRCLFYPTGVFYDFPKAELRSPAANRFRFRGAPRRVRLTRAIFRLRHVTRALCQSRTFRDSGAVSLIHARPLPSLYLQMRLPVSSKVFLQINNHILFFFYCRFSRAINKKVDFRISLFGTLYNVHLRDQLLSHMKRS